MRRRHVVSPGISGHYWDLRISSLHSHDSACNFILSVAVTITRNRELFHGKRFNRNTNHAGLSLVDWAGGVARLSPSCSLPLFGCRDGILRRLVPLACSKKYIANLRQQVFSRIVLQNWNSMLTQTRGERRQRT